MAKLTRILSIDGGGIRGILPGQILVELEKILQEKTQDPSARIADFFDMIAGTSTGGILTCLYLCPESAQSKRPKYSAQEAVDIYLERGDEIFDVSVWQRIRSAGGVRDEKFDAAELESALLDYMENTRLSHLLKPCLITSYNIEKRYPHFFTQHDALKKPSYDFFIKDVARATSAAPTYFEAARIQSLTQTVYALIDGGMFANNPALCAYAEARKITFRARSKQPTASQMAFLSLGTAEIKKPYPHKKAKNWGLVEWVRPVIDILMSGNADTVSYQLKQIYDAVGKPDQFLRIVPDLHEASPDMDDASAKNLSRLKEAGAKSALKYRKEMEKFADLLIRNA